MQTSEATIAKAGAIPLPGSLSLAVRRIAENLWLARAVVRAADDRLRASSSAFGERQ
jgi:hypothetical protein